MSIHAGLQDMIAAMSRSDATPQAVIALETSSANGSVCLGIDDEILETRRFSGSRRHALELLPTIAELIRIHGLSPRSISGIGLSIGPGSFTGLRIAATTARALSLAVEARIAAVPTLTVIAQNALLLTAPPIHVGVVLDAKRSHTYAALFRRAGQSYSPVTAPAELDPARFVASLPVEARLLGEGITYHRAAIEASGIEILPEEFWPPRAETVYKLAREQFLTGRTTDRCSLIPIYVRPPEAEEKYRLRHTDEPAMDGKKRNRAQRSSRPPGPFLNF